MERIQIECDIAGERCSVQADRKTIADQPGDCYQLTENGRWLGYICKHPDGRYRVIGTSELNQDDIDAIGEQIDQQLK